MANLDLAIQNGAFVIDLMPDDPDDAALLAEIFGQLEPLFDAYGWARDEHAWTRAVSVGGGVVFCSFASPNLSVTRQQFESRAARSTQHPARSTLQRSPCTIHPAPCTRHNSSTHWHLVRTVTHRCVP